MKVIVKKSSYRYDELKPAFFGIMDAIGGRNIPRGSRILVKPNMLSAATPEQALLTHPLIIRAAAEYVKEMDAHVLIADSQAIGSFDRIARENGTTEALRDLDLEFRPFQESVVADIGKPFDAIDLAADALDADFVINLPKLKTHEQMLLTLAVKNMFGCVVGFRKAEWHMRTGINRELFAKLLVLICRRINPGFTVLDGILGMEGEGPGKRGIPRQIGVMMGSSDPFAVDAAVCRLIGIEPERLLTLKAASEMGLVDEVLEIEETLPEVRNFKLPDMVSPMFGPKQVHGFIRRHFLQRPVVDEPLCNLCGECWKICPAKAISHDTKMLYFDHNKCIRCYCCIEICPHAALHTEETLPGRIIRRIVFK